MKKLSKKLTLNKETISALNNVDMQNIKGGVTRIWGLYCGRRKTCNTKCNTC